MPKFKHQDEEDYETFCEHCQTEHSANIPEDTCRKNALKWKERLLEEQRDYRWNRDEEKRQDWE